MPHQGDPVTTEEDIATLLENFFDYFSPVGPGGEPDPWFSLAQINQQFAWTDIPEEKLTGWLDKLIAQGKVEASTEEAEEGEGTVYRWLS